MAVFTICAKCSDLCYVSFEGRSNDGYVPSIPAIGGGDFVEIQIDNETGKVVGWVPLTVESFVEACGGEEDFTDEDEED